jgi:hypothetical protein
MVVAFEVGRYPRQLKSFASSGFALVQPLRTGGQMPDDGHRHDTIRT